jgi:hypothetical protein
MSKGMSEHPNLSQLVLMVVGRHWTDHWPATRHSTGALDPAIVAALMEDRALDFKKDDERVVYDLVAELLNNRSVSDTTYRRTANLLVTKA